MYSKPYLCLSCDSVYSKSLVELEAEATPERIGKCIPCNLADLKAADYEAKHTYIQGRDQPLQRVIQADTLGIGNPPTHPPIELIAQEPEVIEYNEQGHVVMRWERHITLTGDRYYQDQNGNKWHYNKLS